jgi:hypothetical protein
MPNQELTDSQKQEILNLHNKKYNFERISKVTKIHKNIVRVTLYDFGIRNTKPNIYDEIDRKCLCMTCRKFHIKRVNYTGPKEFPPYFCDSCRHMSTTTINPTGELDQEIFTILKNQHGELK